MNNLNDSRLNLATTFEGGGLYIFLTSFILKVMSGSQTANVINLTPMRSLRAGPPVRPALRLPPSRSSHKDSLVTQDTVTAAGNTTAFHL